MSLLQDKAFETSKLYQAHNNPAAELSSSLKHYQQHSLERAYKGVDFFWALTPSHNDYILIKFLQPIHVSGCVATLQMNPSNIKKYGIQTSLATNANKLAH